jgi:hypothetical protein
MDISTKISRDLVKEAVSTKIERNIDLPIILQALENQGFNERAISSLGALFDYELGYIKQSRPMVNRQE